MAMRVFRVIRVIRVEFVGVKAVHGMINHGGRGERGWTRSFFGLRYAQGRFSRI